MQRIKKLVPGPHSGLETQQSGAVTTAAQDKGNSLPYTSGSAPGVPGMTAAEITAATQQQTRQIQKTGKSATGAPARVNYGGAR
tara:strand:- start:64 stop:315 length:252 start_codon:yes stop_codon:yes gene_type:complete